MKKNTRTKKIPTVTVAVCALNEEHNIQSFLKSVLAQKEEGYKLEKIICISDGSTDQTVARAKKVKSDKLVVLDHKERIGKSSRLNEIYAMLTSDIVVLPDADVVFADEHVISHLIAPLTDSKVGMTGGHPLPFPAKTFVEQAVNLTLSSYIPLRPKYDALSATGRIMALSKKFAKEITMPAETISNDGFTYFSCLTHGYKYQYVPEAVVYFRSPQTLYDHVNQNTRFDATPAFMKRYFPAELVEREYWIDPQDIQPLMLKAMLSDPIHALAIFFINRYCLLMAKIKLSSINSLWEVVYSSKKVIQR